MVAPPVVARSTHPAVAAARKLRRRRARSRAGLLLVEGPNALAEAIGNLEQVFLAGTASEQSRAVAGRCRDAGVPVITVTSAVLAALADAETPQGVVGVARRPTIDLATVTARADLLVVLDAVADPGNAGTIIRTADAAGADGVVLTSGSVDPTNAKAVRASAGSLFHLPVIDDVPGADVVAACRAAGLRLLAATPDGSTSYTDLCYTDATAIVFGNEAHGLSDNLVAQADGTVSVPMTRSARLGYHGSAESLNLATTAAVVLFEIVRQRNRVERMKIDDSRAQ
ncbi:MAG TPA: RNA methyltransferase [Euzebyales bacterium]|nr:RNA methyltransferase [Euzebyales bacterium]